MSEYRFVAAFVDPNNIFVKNNYVYVKENAQHIQRIKDINPDKAQDEQKVIIHGVTPVQKQTEISKTDLAIETNQIKQPDALDTSHLKAKKRKIQVYNDSLS